jgi:hypothetical protein
MGGWVVGGEGPRRGQGGRGGPISAGTGWVRTRCVADGAAAGQTVLGISEAAGRRAMARAPTEPFLKVTYRSRRPATIDASVACRSGLRSRKLYRVKVKRPLTISWPSIAPTPLKTQSWGS